MVLVVTDVHYKLEMAYVSSVDSKPFGVFGGFSSQS